MLHCGVEIPFEPLSFCAKKNVMYDRPPKHDSPRAVYMKNLDNQVVPVLYRENTPSELVSSSVVLLCTLHLKHKFILQGRNPTRMPVY